MFQFFFSETSESTKVKWTCCVLLSFSLQVHTTHRTHLGNVPCNRNKVLFKEIIFTHFIMHISPYIFESRKLNIYQVKAQTSLGSCLCLFFIISRLKFIGCFNHFILFSTFWHNFTGCLCIQFLTFFYMAFFVCSIVNNTWELFVNL